MTLSRTCTRNGRVESWWTLNNASPVRKVDLSRILAEMKPECVTGYSVRYSSHRAGHASLFTGAGNVVGPPRATHHARDNQTDRK